MDLLRRSRRPKPRYRRERPPSGFGGSSPGSDDGRSERKPSDRADHLPSRRLGWKVFVELVLVTGLAASVLSASAWYAYVSSLRRLAGAH
jgi:hypothetical protein